MITKDLMPIGELLSATFENGALPDPVIYQYYKSLERRQIIINQEIGDDIFEMAIMPYMEMDNDGSNKPIEILISTVGGDIYKGFALIDVIERTKTPTTIHIVGQAASMGTLIAMAGKNNPHVRTVCNPFSVGLIHSGSFYLEGATHAVRDTFNFSEQYEEKIKNYIISHSKISEEYYEKIERKELWLDSDEMLRLGIVDEII